MPEWFIQGNKRKLYKYSIHHSYVAGLALPPLAAGKILKKSLSLNNGYVNSTDQELFLNNFLDKKLKLLLNRREINQIIELSKREKYVILPGNVFLKNRRIKVEIHLCKYNKNSDKEKQKYRRSKEKRKACNEDFS
ncbi:SsrA-binding protein [Candidatus Mycoplasma haematominutum]|uniref:SsrA-binding protein n=1 Tax=Candidatus Mycoplasma haematominutum TaxID=209446 RepID=UPI0002EBA3DD|nr:SsrA-binding protein [Candidatus Mycoplasma haematominutum]